MFRRRARSICFSCNKRFNSLSVDAMEFKIASGVSFSIKGSSIIVGRTVEIAEEPIVSFDEDMPEDFVFSNGFRAFSIHANHLNPKITTKKILKLLVLLQIIFGIRFDFNQLLFISIDDIKRTCTYE